MRYPHEPDYVPSPARTLRSWMYATPDYEAEAAKVGITKETLLGLIAGTTPMTPSLANQLEELTGYTAAIWEGMAAAINA